MAEKFFFKKKRIIAIVSVANFVMNTGQIINQRKRCLNIIKLNSEKKFIAITTVLTVLNI